MNTIKNIGLIAGEVSGTSFQHKHLNYFSDYNIKKVWVEDKASEGIMQAQYPNAELVKDRNAILNDVSIDLIILSQLTNDTTFVGKILQSGKQVRVL